MTSAPPLARVAIVDYGMGNLFSVALACSHVGLDGRITSDPEAVDQADAVILPGVGAFGDAMRTLRRTGLADAIRRRGEDGTPLFGICLGMQLFMTESLEFGRHAGLDLVAGRVIPFEAPLRVPQIGWNLLRLPAGTSWDRTLLKDVPEFTYMYFVHSYHAVPKDPSIATSLTSYGATEFCSSFSKENVFACQFHPERSGPEGLKLFRNFAGAIRQGEAVPEDPGSGIV